MSKFTLRVAIDPEDLYHIRHMESPEIYLWPHMKIAMSESLDEVELQAQDWMDILFQNPTGHLADAFAKYVWGYDEAELENDEPYAQRTNEGFSGMTDSLGRFFPYWPDYHWAEKAVETAYPEVELIWQVEMDRALGRI